MSEKPAPYAYRAPAVNPSEAKEHPTFARVLHAGPWMFSTHPHGGTIAFLNDYPDTGQNAAANFELYGEPVDCGDGLLFLPPRAPVSIYDLVHGDRDGADITLACGTKVTIPVATTQHRQFRLRGADRLGKPVTEYGRLAVEIFEAAVAAGQLSEEDPRVWRVLELAFSQRYRVTADMLDHLGLIAREDVDPLLSVIWTGDPKALRPANADAESPSASSASTTTKT